jgi:hypothetical protein
MLGAPEQPRQGRVIRFCENRKNDGCDGQTSDYSCPADKCAARRRAAAALDRLDGWVKARSFFCCSLLVVSRRGQKAHGCALGVLGRSDVPKGDGCLRPRGWRRK